MIKKIGSFIMIIIIFITVLYINSFSSTYTREVIVTNTKGKTVEVKDRQGNIFEFTTKEYLYTKNQELILTMKDNNTTSNIKDDIIINVELNTNTNKDI